MFKNVEMEAMLESLGPLLEHRNVIGYAAARNTRILRAELEEYLPRKAELVQEYGEEATDQDGNPTGMWAVRPDSERFPEFFEKYNALASIEHDPQIMRVRYEDAIGVLSGSEMLAYEWMLED